MFSWYIFYKFYSFLLYIEALLLGQWLSTWVVLPPRELFAMSGDIFDYQNLRDGYYRYLEDRSQECCLISYNAWDKSPQQRMTWAKMQ